MPVTRVDRRVDEDLRRAVRELKSTLKALPKRSGGDGDAYLRTAFEQLLTSALALAGARYGCALGLAGEGAYRARLLKLIGVVEACGSRGLAPVHDVLIHRKPDTSIRSVLLNGETITEDRATHTPSCLPRGHPEIESYLMLPVKVSTTTRALILLANNDDSFNQRLIRRLMSLIEAFERLHLQLNRNALVAKSVDPMKASRHLVALMSASLNGIVTVNEAGLITAINPASEGLLRLTTQHALGMDARELLGADIVENALADPDRQPAGFHQLAPRKFEAVDCRRSDGTVCPLDVVFYSTEIQHRRFVTFLLNDASGVAKSTSELQDALQRYQALTNLAPVGILHLNVDWTCVYANDMWSELSELSKEETLNDGWIDAIHADDVVDTLVDMREALCNRQTFEREVRVHRPLGSVLWVHLKATATVNEHDVFNGCLVVAMDITEKHLWSEKMAQMARFDTLTGIANRARFYEILNARLESSRCHGPVALLYVDLDGFKAVNDTLGHDAGDTLLSLVAKRLVKASEDRGLPARLGGDEFTVIVDHGHDLDTARDMAEAIVNTMKIPFTVDSQEVHVAASVGVAVSNPEDTGVDDLLKRADTALYEAKKTGRSRWIEYSADLDQDSRERSRLMTRICRAADHSGLDVHYQPQIDLASGQVNGFEALLRWVPTSEEPSVNTTTLVGILEDCGRINDVGQWVLETACEQLMSWRKAELIADSVSMSVNVSARQLNLRTFRQRLLLIVERTGIRPENLVLEMTESALFEASPAHEKLFSELTSDGFKLSLDDFGTGFSSLAYLSRLRLDHLKIDRSFVSTMRNDPRSRVIVNSVIALADSLDMQTVAEGVEETADAQALLHAGCQTVQGHLYAPAMPGSAIEGTFLRRAS